MSPYSYWLQEPQQVLDNLQLPPPEADEDHPQSLDEEEIPLWTLDSLQRMPARGYL